MSRTRLIGESPRRVMVIVCDKGEDPVKEVTKAARAADIRAAQVTAVGALRSAHLGYFDRDRRDYAPIDVHTQVEVLSMIGDIALKDGTPTLHAHVVLGHPDGETVGGHLQSGEVWPTLEVVMTEVGPELAKEIDPETGLALLAP